MLSVSGRNKEAGFCLDWSDIQGLSIGHLLSPTAQWYLHQIHSPSGQGSSWGFTEVNIRPAACEHHLGPKQFLHMPFLTQDLGRESAARHSQLHTLLILSINQPALKPLMTQTQHEAWQGHHITTARRVKASWFFSKKGKGRLVLLLLIL